MFQHKFRIVWVLAFTLLLCVGSHNVLAKKKSSKKGGGGGGGTSAPADSGPPQAPPEQATPDPTNPLAVADNAAIEDDLKEVSADQQSVLQITTQLETAFEQTQPWLDAKGVLDKAKADLDAAQTACLTNLAGINPDFAQAKTDKDKADAALQAGKDTPDIDPDQIGVLASDEVKATAALEAVKKEAFATDAACQAAQGRVVTAQQTMAQLLADFKTTLPNNPDFADAEKKLGEANKKLTEARAKLAADTAQATPPAAAAPGT